MSEPAESPDDVERRRLARLRLLHVMDTEPEPVFDALARITAAVCGTPIALVGLIDENRQWYKANHGLAGATEAPRALTFCEHTIRQDSVMQVPDATRDTRFAGNPFVTGDPNVRFYAGAPIVMPGGERIGSLCVIDSKPGRLDAQQEKALADLALVVEWALTRRARLHELTTLGDESRFQAISYASPLGIFQAEEHGGVFYANGRWEELHGMPIERAMGFGWLDAVHPADRPAASSAWADAVANTQPFDMEYRLQPPNGPLRWVRSQARPARWGEPPRAGWTGVLADITIRREAQRRQRETLELLSKVLDSIPCGVSVFDRDLKLITNNQQFPALLDFPDHFFEANDTTFEDLIRYNAKRGEYGPGEVEDIVRRIVEQATAPGQHHTQRTRPNGVTLDIRGAPMPGGGFVATYVDVSTAKAAEQALRLSEERQKRALDASRLALWDLDLATNKLYLSENWAAMMGHAPEATVTDPQAMLDRVPADEQEDVGEAFESVLKGGRASYMVEHRVRRDDGSTFWIHSEGKVTLRNAEGRALQMTGTNQDISERKAIDAELYAARQLAEDANEAKTEFLHNVSHEIRTPLNGVLGMLRMLQSEALTARQHEFVKLATTSASSLLGLINDLLDLGKIEAGRLELEETRFSLIALLRDLEQLWTLSAADKGIAFRLELSAQVPDEVVGDPARLKQILNNLLSNALKFTVQGSVTLAAGRADPGEPPGRQAMLQFQVRDTGIGIPQEVQDRLFDRFMQADTSTTRKYGGTGLGLAIVRHLCEQMGGGISLASGPGKGAIFTVELPMPLAAEEPHAPAATALPRSGGTNPLRILLAEDNPTNQVVAQGLLSLAGYEDVTTVADGEEAVAAVESGHFDLVLMDCRMPRLDGYGATQRLRDAGCTLPIIALTANASPQERERCLAHGMNDFLTKPINEVRLVETLARWAPAGTQEPASSRPAPLYMPPATRVAAPPPVVARAPASSHAFSRAAALEQLSGDEDLLAAVLESFRQHGPDLLRQARSARAQGDAVTLHRHLHSLAGSAGTLGAAPLSKMARELEALAQSEQFAQLDARMPEIEALMDAFLAEAAGW